MTSSTPGDPLHSGDPTHGQPGQPQYGQPVPPESGQPQYGQPAYAPPPASQPPGYGQGQQYGQAPQHGQAPQYGQHPQYGQPQYAQQSAQSPYGQPNNPYGAPQGSMYGGVATANSGFVTIPNLGTVKVATIGQRFLARLIDLVVYLVIFGIMFAIGATSLASSSTTTVDPYTGATYTTASSGGVIGFLIAVSLIVLIGFLYEWLFIAFKGQTLGKMAMGVKVIREDNGQVPGLGKSFIRQIIPGAAWAICSIVGLLFYISVFFDSSGRNQTWYDKAANDLVISTK